MSLPAVVDVPAPVLQILRGLDPTLDLYVLPSGIVWLLLKSDKPARIAAGREELTVIRADADNIDRTEPIYSSNLMAEGFEQLGEYPFFYGMSAGAMLREATRKLYATETEIRETMLARRAISDGTNHKIRARATMRERVVLGAADDYAMAFRGRKSFSRVR